MPYGNVLLLGSHGSENRETLQSLLSTRWTIRTWGMDQSDADLETQMADADALVIGPDALLSGRVLPRLPLAQQLRLFQIPFAGHDWLKPGTVPPECTVCNLHEHSSAIAEFVLLAMLEWQIGMRHIDHDFHQGSWKYNGSRLNGIKHGEIRDKTLGLFGYGHIGAAVAARAAAFGMRVAAVGSRDRESVPAPLAWFGGPASLPRLCQESDFLVVACALNDHTRGAIDHQALDAMKSSAVLINVARAAVVVEDDLYAALRQNTIGGAVLDVWYTEPTQNQPRPQPSRHPFHELANVVMSPHCAGWTHEQGPRRWRAIAENLDRLADGRPLRDVVAGPQTQGV